jgi:flagellar motor switch protein FliM
MSQPLLSAEELDALAHGLDDGTITTDKGLNTDANVVSYDLARDHSTTTINTLAIDLLMERMARQLRLGLQTSLRSESTVETRSSEIKPYGEFIASLKAPISINILRLMPLRGLSLLVIEPEIIFVALDRFFGGPGRGIKEIPDGRLFTATEQRIIKKMVEVVLRCLSEAWAPVIQMHGEPVGSEAQPQFAQITDDKDLVLITPLSVQISDTKSIIQLVYPLEGMKPIREALNRRIVSKDEEEEGHNRWSELLADAIGDVELEARAILAEFESTLREFEQLKEGDVLWFKRPRHMTLTAEKTPLYSIEMGTANGQTAVQIIEPLEPRNTSRRFS